MCFCRAPWNGLTIMVDGKVYPCCMALDAEPVGNILYESLSDIWEGSNLQNFREKMETDENWRNYHCRRCIEYEKAANCSVRMSYNMFPYSKEEPEPVCLDIRLSNRCNLACVSCGPWASSRWEKEVGGTPVINVGEYAGDTLKTFIKDRAVHLKKITIAGGEPTIMSEVYDILNAIKEKGNLDLEIAANINGQVLGYGQRNFLELIEPFHNVHISFSIDALGDLAENMRYGCRWENVRNNLDKMLAFKSKMKGLRVSISPTVSILNILHIVDLYEFFESNYPDVWIQGGNLLTSPEEFCLFNLPENIKSNVKEILLNQKDRLKLEMNRHYIDEYISFMCSKEECGEDFYNQAVLKLTTLDNRRHTRMMSFIPK